MRHPLEEHSQHYKNGDPFDGKINKAASLIKAARYTTVLTGAGSSTPSGIPDFRTPGSGLWTRFSPSDYASLTAFRHHPEEFFQWLRPLASLLFQATPNPSHEALSQLEEHGLVRSVITQNIDCLHQKAGSKMVIEVHGTLDTLSCCGCFQQFPSRRYMDAYLDDGAIPICPHCNRILKPDVVLFGEQLPIKSWLKAKTEIKHCDLMIVAGSSLTVTPACELPLLALNNQAKLIIINLTPTYIDSYAEIVIHGDVSNVLPSIVAEVIND